MPSRICASCLKFDINKIVKSQSQLKPSWLLKKDYVLEFISKKKSVTKKELLDYMGWGVRIAFNPYRNKLRTESNIRFTKNRYEVI